MYFESFAAIPLPIYKFILLEKHNIMMIKILEFGFVISNRLYIYICFARIEPPSKM